MQKLARYVAASLPFDASAGASSLSLGADFVTLRDANHCEVIIQKRAGGAGEPLVLTMRQAKDAAGTGEKDLAFSNYTLQMGVGLDTIGTPTFTTKGSASIGGDATLSLVGDQQAIAVIEIDGQDLDVNNGYDWIRVTMADPGATAQLVSVLYRMSEISGNPYRTNFIA